MIKNQKFVKSVLLGIFVINIFMMMIPAHEEGFGESDHFFASLLRGLGYEQREPVKYNHIPALTSEGLSSRAQDQDAINNINFRISDYFIPGWADTRWQYRKNITVDSAKVISDLFNFPVLIDLYDQGLQNEAQASGNDIMFTNVNGWILDHEIENYNRVYNSTHAHLVAWVNTNLTSSQDTIISMYYGNPTIDNQENPTGVWDANYAGVWHLPEDPSGTPPQMLDSTSNDNDGTSEGTMLTEDQVEFQIDGSLDFDGTDDYVNVGSASSLDNIEVKTVSAWVQLADNGYANTIVAKGSESAQTGWFLFYDPDGGRHRLAFMQAWSGTIAEWHTADLTMDVDTMFHVAVTYNRGSTTNDPLLYIDGVPMAVTERFSPSGTIGDDAALDCFIAKYGPLPLFGYGNIDEVRISDVMRSAEWIKTEYNNQDDPDTFFSVSSKEENSNHWVEGRFRYRKTIVIDKDEVSADLTNFPVLIDLTDTDFKSGRVQSDADDIIFTDQSGAKLDHEVEYFSQNSSLGSLITWVRVPSLSSITDTNITMYYGNNAVRSQENPESVWDSSYLAVHHMEESPVGTLYDSTDNNEDLTPEGLLTSNDLTNAQIGKGIDFDDSNDDGMVSTSTISIDNFTVSAWINPDTIIDDYDTVINLGHAIGTYGWVGLRNGVLKIKDINDEYSFGPALSSDTWYHIIITYDGSTIRGYVDGSFRNSYSVSWSQITYKFQVGGFAWSASYDLTDFFDGIIDEARIINAPRSAEWIQTEYNNQDDPTSFYSVTSEEVHPYWWADASFGKRKDIAIDKDQVSGDLANFPVLIDIYDSDLRTDVQTDAADLMFTDSFNTKLAHEIEFFDQTGNGTHAHLIAWVSIPTLFNNTDTLLSMYYGNNKLTSQENSEGVWREYVGVWHLSEASGNAKDSTSFDTDGAATSMNYQQPGVVGYGMEWTSSSSLLNMGDPADSHLDFGTGDFTLGIWVKVDQDIGWEWIVSKGAQDSSDEGYGLISDDTPVSHWRAITGDTTQVEASPSDFSLSEWNYIVCKLDRETDLLYIYSNGTEEATGDASALGNIDNLKSLRLPMSSSYYFDGWVDEFRLTNLSRSANWIQTEYVNYHDPSSFYTVGSEYELDNTPPVLNDFGVEDPGTGTGTFWADITDAHSGVDSAIIKVNGTEYGMSSNGTHWVKQLSIAFNGYYLYQVSNASDVFGNTLSTPSNNKSHTFNFDSIFPNVLDWEYISSNNTFQANVTDSWGTIDTVIVNVTTHSLTATMVYYTTFSGTKFAYMNNSLSMPNGPINFLVFVNDTSGNAFSSTTHSGNVYDNTAPVASDLTLSRDQFQVLLPIYSNCTLYLDYTYYDEDAHPEDGTEIRWYKDNGTGFTLQVNRNDSTSIPVSVLYKGNQWYATVKPKDGELFGTMVNTSSITVQNTPPQISSVVISPSTPVTTQQLTVSNSTTDPDGDPITEYEVRWFNPSLNSSYTNLSTIPSDQTLKGETWWCEVRAYDGTNVSVWFKSNNVTIGNSAPSASSLLITPSNPKTANTLTATYTYSDVDNDIESNSKIRWYKNSALQPALNDSITVDSSLTSKGQTWYFTIEPYDGTSYGDFQQSSAVTIENTAPTALTLNITPSSPHTGQDLTANYTFFDADDDTSSGTELIWYKDGTLQGALNGSITVSFSYTSNGEEWHFKVRPSDGTDYGLWASCPVNVTIGNAPPTASNAYITPSNPKTSDTLSVNYDYSDTDSDPESGSLIIWYKNGILQGGLNNSISIQAGNTSKGEEWHFKVRPSDGFDYGSWVGSTNITIGNTAPIASTLTIFPSTPKTHHTLNASYSFSDADNDGESGSLIRWYKNGELQVDLNDSLIVDSSLTSKGENWYFTITPSDGSDSGSLEQSATAIIENSAPEAINLQIIPGSPKTANDLNASYTFTDNDSDGDIGSLIIWYKNNVLQGALNDSRTVGSGYTTKGDVWHFKVRPSDGTDYGSWTDCPTNVTIGNTAPSASNANISPGSPKTGDDLTANYDYSDSDSDLESGSEIIWYLNGVLQGALNGSFVNNAGNTFKSEEWHFKIRPNDGTDFGTWMGSTNVTIGNTAPAVSSLDILPSNPQTHHTLNASYSFSDADNDGESGSLIRWYKSGVLQVNLNDSLTVDSSLTSKGENWYFTITPSDGSDSGSLEQSATAIIENSAPEATNLQITPGSPKTANDLNASYIFADNDSDSETDSLLIWYKNNVLQGALNDSSIIDSSFTAKGDVWHFKVRPSDGTEYGNWTGCPTNVTIGNTEPIATNLQITPTDPITSESLTAAYTWADNDTSDSNTETEIRWYKNGALQIVLNDLLTITAGNTSKSDVWHFKVRPNDGTDFGGWYSCPVNVTIGNTPPQATNVKINETSPVPEDFDLHVLYTYSDYDSDNESSSWIIRWYKNGVLQTNLNDSMTISSGNTTIGDIWYFTIQVSDGTNLSSLVTSASVSIATAPNQIPVASTLNFSNSNPTTTDYLYINWTYSDGDTDPEYGSMYYWYRNGVYLSQYDGLQNLSASATTKGEEWHVKITPRDGSDFGNLVGVPINVTIGNTAPSASNLAISPSSPITGTDLSVSYAFSDLDSDGESGSEIIWYLDGVLQGALNGSTTVQAGNTSKNEAWHFKVRPKDGADFGSWVSCPINVTIGNTAPSASNLVITPSGAKTANDLIVSYDFADTDSGDSESNSYIRWFRNLVELTSFENQTTVPAINTSKGQTWYFSIQPSDGSDFGNIKTSVAILILNTAPAASSLTISPSNPQTTDSLMASYTWTDPDNATDTESGSLITWYKDGILQGALNDSDQVTFTYTSKGEEWHFKVRPKDGSEFGSWISCPSNITIINSAPTTSGLTITPTNPKTTNDLVVSYTFSDVDSDTESGSQIIWYLDGVLQGVLNGSTTVQAGNTSKNEAWHFKVRPNDGTEYGSWVSCLINVTIGNTVPSVSNLAITPGDAKTVSDLTATYDFADIDSGDSESNTLIRWFRNSIELTSFENQTTIPAINTNKGQTWYFTIQPSDGSDYGNDKTSAAILILNTAPAASSLSISPSTPQTTNSLLASYTWADPDNATDTESGSLIIWYKDGVLQGALNNTASVDSSYLSKGEEWHFKVLPKDGTDFGTWVSCPTNITVINSAPTTSGLAITPVDPKTTNDLIVSYTFSDVDSDTESGSQIIWYLDGVLQGVLNGSTTVQAGNTSKNEAWHFKVRPNDGTEYGSWVSCLINVTITNTAPSVSNLQLNPSDPTTGDTLIASYTYSDVDLDGESGTQIRWYKNGMLQGSLNDLSTVDSSLTSKGENWYFTITPHDGTETGDSKGSSLLTIGNLPPFVGNLTFIPTTPTAGNDLMVTYDWADVDASDTESGTQLRWYRNALLQSTYNDLDTIPGGLILKGENWTVSIRTSDGTDSSLKWENASILIGNSAPSITSAVVTPATPRTLDDLEVSLSAFDMDSDPILAYSIEWWLDGSHEPAYDNYTTLPAENTAKGQVWQIRVKAFDGNDWSVSTNSITRFILNTKPSVANVTVTGGTTTSTNITLAYDFFDVDGDIPSTPIITWRYIGETSGLVLGQLVIPASITVAGQRWWVEVTPRDIEALSGDLYNSWDHGMISIIGNTPPGIQSNDIAIKGEFNGTEYSGNSFGTIFNLNLHYNATDIDGEEGVIAYGLNMANGFALGSEYRWYRNRSGVVTMVAILNDQTTVPYYYTEKNDQWWVQVHPRDFYGDFGVTVNSSSIVIGNTYPFLRVFNWVRSNPTKNDNIEFQFEYFDWDNDPIDEAETLLLIVINQTSGGLIYRNCTISSVVSAFDIDLNRFYYIITVVFPSGEYQKNDRLNVILRPYDGTNWASVNFTSSSITIANILPTTTSRSLYPTHISNIDVLYLNWTYTDADGDPENLSWIIRWYKNGVHQSMFDNQRSIPLNETANGEIWKVDLQVFDGSDHSDPYNDLEITTKSLLINYIFDTENSQVAPNVRVNEFVVEDENLTISYFFTNIDDALGSRIQWFSKEQNETWIERPEFEGNTSIGFQFTNPGEKWYCLITPFDGVFLWSKVNSSSIFIESRPVIHTLPSDIASAVTDVEGHYYFTLNTTDSKNPVAEVLITLNDGNPYYATFNPTTGLWVVDYQIQPNQFIEYLNTEINGTIAVTCHVNYGTQFDIYQTIPFNFTVYDVAAPRVLDAFFNRNEDINPTNLTFYAHVQEYGSGISEVGLSYYFKAANKSEPNSGGIGSFTTQEDTLNWLNADMVYHNTSVINNEVINVYKITVPFNPNGTNWEVIYRISTSDNDGNVDPLAFDIKTDPDRERDIIIFTPPGIDPTLVLLIVGVTILIAIFSSLVYVKFIRKPELVGLDKELVLLGIKDISEEEVNESLDHHTLGIITSFFDQRHGPIPIIVIPDILKDNFNKLVELSDRSFSGTGFSDNYEIEIPSSYDFVLDQGIRTSILSFGFALNKPEARGGQENLTLNILVHQDIFPLVQSFQKSVQQKTHEIHVSMAEENTEKTLIRQSMIDLRKYISYIILSYKNIYDTTELLEEDRE